MSRSSFWDSLNPSSLHGSGLVVNVPLTWRALGFMTSYFCKILEQYRQLLLQGFLDNASAFLCIVRAFLCMSNFKIILLDLLYPPGYLALRVPEIQKPSYRSMIRPEQEFSPVEILMEVLYSFYYCQQYFPGCTIILLWFWLVFTPVSNNLFITINFLREHSVDTFVASIHVQN